MFFKTLENGADFSFENLISSNWSKVRFIMSFLESIRWISCPIVFFYFYIKTAMGQKRGRMFQNNIPKNPMGGR
ncbi:hypothetical protein P872_09965 [Rhodonellum psychrophilum GCM71 = DSM 17998]|uniref:Uncharacterized protein n=1 Tax=Rhodonellum psychrophilum GCM71 = DSM 17998 TaxID=1123057 RepID=U5BZY8_9BACT|nr:hypothetical protein P872_09965 [Rhodonellum psychrophilum GCM71 = DSM 17998]